VSDPSADRLPKADPDSRARTHLANERTFLAWLRTGLSLIALGLAAAQFLRGLFPGGVALAVLLAVLLIIIGTIMVIFGGWRYIEARDQIEAQTYVPSSVSVVFSVVLVAIGGLLALAFVVIFR